MRSLPKEFIMLCGLPKTGKTEIAKKESERLLDCGMYQVDSKMIYPVGRMMSDIAEYMDKNKIIETLISKDGGDNQVFTVISMSGIKDELSKDGYFANDATLSLISEARLNIAFSRGYTVIYDAMNLNKDTRQKYLELADKFDVRKRKLIISDTLSEEPVDTKSNPTAPLEAFLGFRKCLNLELPSIQEGWDSVTNYSPCTES